MRARDVDQHDVEMLEYLARQLRANVGNSRIETRYGRLLAIAEFLSRHVPELAECEHGALRGRCEVDGCEPENFESDHVVNRAQEVADLCDAAHSFTLTESISQHYFSSIEFAELTRLAWIGARASHINPAAR